MHPINRLLSKVGLRVTRADTNGAPNEAALRTIGKFQLMLPAPTWAAYRASPDVNSPIGRLVAHVARHFPDARAIDIGANAGDTIAVLKSAADIPILAIEGDAACFDLLCRNVQQFAGVKTIQQFLGDREEVVSLSVEKEGWNTTLVPRDSSPGAREISLTTLDHLLRDDPDRAAYRFIKVDAEGFDPKIIRGARTLLTDVKPVVYFEYNELNMSEAGEDGVSLLTLLRSLGYSRLLVWDSFGRFLLATQLDQPELLADLHDYVHGFAAQLGYWDFCAFHMTQDDLAAECIAGERAHRVAGANSFDATVSKLKG